MLLVERPSSGDGCWIWRGPRHSSGAGRFLWRIEDGGTGKYTYARRVAFFLAEGEIPRYLKNLCGHKMCVKPSHHWRKPSEPFKPKPRKAVGGRSQQLSDEEVRHVRLLSSLGGGDEDEIGRQDGLRKRQTADIALGRVRHEAGGRIRTSRHRGIRYYHDQHEQELASLSMRPDEPVVPHSPDDPPSQVHLSPSNDRTGSPRSPLDGPFPSMSYGQDRRRLPQNRRW